MIKLKKIKLIGLILVCLISLSFRAQNVELDSLIAKAIKNNKGIQAGQFQVNASKANRTTAFMFEKTNLYYAYDQNNLALNNEPIKVFGIQQKFNFPSLYLALQSKYQADFEKQQSYFEIQKNQLSHQVAKTYYHIVYLQHQEQQYRYLDSLYRQFSKASERKFQLGESNYLEKITAESKYRKIQMLLLQLQNEKEGILAQLAALVQSIDKLIPISNKKLAPIVLKNGESSQTFYTSFLEKNSKSQQANVSVQKRQLLPDINLEYFGGKNAGLSQPLYGFQVGLAFPLLFSGHSAKIKTAKLELQSWEMHKENELERMKRFLEKKQLEGQKYQEAILYYDRYGKKLSEEILKVATQSFKQGEIDFFQYIQSLENATNIELDYLDNVFQFNKNQLDMLYMNYETDLNSIR